jgi:hypothetical protein
MDKQEGFRFEFSKAANTKLKNYNPARSYAKYLEKNEKYCKTT